MEINIADNFVKFQDKKDNLEDKETLFVLSPKYKKFRDTESESPNSRKISKKSLVGLTITLVLIGGLVTGLTVGLVLSKMKNENLTQKLENLNQDFENLQQNFSKAQNSSQETITYLETLVEAHEDLALHFEIEHEKHINELKKNFTKSKNLTKIEIEDLKLQNENLLNKTKELINTQERRTGRTQLHKATLINDTKEVEILLKLGADPNIRDIHNNTPLEFANFYGYTEIAQMLKKYGATFSL